MEKDMSRRCSHCGLNGHNSRTCSEKGVKLFGVTLTDGMIRKSVSMGNLALYNNSQQATQSSTPEPSESGGGLAADHQGYVSDGLMQSSTSLRERKKGVPWTEHEHRMFLVGLQRLGKGDWRGISRNFVTSRTPTQVASHAQKYFLRQCNNLSKRKRRSSLFDIISSSTVPTSSVSDHSQNVAMEFNLPTSGLSSSHAIPPSLMETVALFTLPPINPAATATVSPDLCLGRPHLQPWQIYASVPSCRPEMAGKQATINALHSTHSVLSSKALDLASQTARGNKIIRPTATLASSSSLSLSSSPSQSSLCRIDEAAELSSLSLSIGPPPSMEPSELSLKLEQPSRHSAFHSSGTASMAGNAGTSLANAIRVV